MGDDQSPATGNVSTREHCNAKMKGGPIAVGPGDESRDEPSWGLGGLKGSESSDTRPNKV